ncbi:DUF485 domain-containing protein [Sphingomonas jatrophae]|uniref:Uncharacterized membrane protein, DUF485 family n=1 Tax=Sphingomonas jatrophae TaxID=1166337 RepID=A0A1I6KZR8_9SPHN|nr:DUF485 domain-containing protein [Sphingomonas jatrophae]SFR96694.1 Uncharacterized membrane protein, DUF485 family [Sphingomonas jatrophae]
MGDDQLEAVAQSPRYRRLVKRRGRLAAVLTTIMLVVYLGYILLVAFAKDWLGRSLDGGATSVGIVVGFGVILLAIALTGFYVWRANREFDGEIAAIVAEASA